MQRNSVKSVLGTASSAGHMALSHDRDVIVQEEGQKSMQELCCCLGSNMKWWWHLE